MQWGIVVWKEQYEVIEEGGAFVGRASSFSFV